MEPAQIQLVFNVVAITGVSTALSFCYLRWRDKQKVAVKRNSAQSTGQVVFADPDIRNFAAHRRAEWVTTLRGQSHRGGAGDLHD